MSRIRKKRKPDTVRLNLVTSDGKQRGIKIRRMSVPLVDPTNKTRQAASPYSAKISHGVGDQDETDLECGDSMFTIPDSPSTLQCPESRKTVRCHKSREERMAGCWSSLRKKLLGSLIESCSHPALYHYSVLCAQHKHLLYTVKSVWHTCASVVHEQCTVI